MGPPACVPHTQYSASWPHRELHRRSQWDCPHASRTPSTAFRGPIDSPTESTSVTDCVRHAPPSTGLRFSIGSPAEIPSRTARMRPAHPLQRFEAPYGAPPKVPVGPPACVPHTQYSVSWPHRERNRFLAP
eukprot:6480077-Pyramimonas_sp.AAC.1